MGLITPSNEESMPASYDADTNSIVSAQDTTVANALEMQSKKAMAPELQGIGMKYDTGKLRASLLRDFPLSFIEIIKVLTFGANKYEAHSWQTVPNAIERYTDAGDRHDLELNKGNVIDEESQCLHEGLS